MKLMHLGAWLALPLGLLAACAVDDDDETLDEVDTVAASATAAPATITALDSTPGGLRLQFTTADPAITSIVINRMDKEEGFYRRLAGVTLDPRQQYVHLDASAVQGREYCYVVVTRTADQTRGTSSSARCAVFVGGGPVPPLPPTNLRINQTRERSLRLAFTDASTDETGFSIEQREGTSWRTVGSIGARTGAGTAIEYSVGDLDLEERYCFRVRATGPGGSSVTLQVCGDTTPVIAPIPVVEDDPVIARIVHPAPGELQVQWNDVPGQREWRVELHDDLSSGVPLAGAVVTDNREVPSTSQAVTFRDLTPGTVYCVRVRRNGHASWPLCESPKAVRTSADQRDPRTAPRVQGLVARNRSLAITLTAPVPGQLLEIVTAATGQRRTMIIDGSGRGELVEDGLRPGETYCVRALVFNAYGARHSDFVCAQTTQAAPARPSDLTVEVAGRRVSMGWPAARDAERYDVRYRGTRPYYGDHDRDETVTGLSWGFDGYEGFTYCVAVRATNAFGSSSWVERCGFEVADDGLTSYGTRLVNDTPPSGNVLFWTNVAGPGQLVSVGVAGNEGVTPYEVQFLGPGLDRSDCGTTAGVRIPAGGTLTGGDLVSLYGAAEPALPLTIAACKIPLAPGGNTLDAIPVQITVRR